MCSTMKLVLRVRVLPSTEQARALQEVLHACNRAAKHSSQVVQATGARNKYALQKAVYADLKAGFGPSAQPGRVRLPGLWCCTPMCMLRAALPTGARLRGSRGRPSTAPAPSRL